MEDRVRERRRRKVRQRSKRRRKEEKKSLCMGIIYKMAEVIWWQPPICLTV
jgi:hypothetical protein